MSRSLFAPCYAGGANSGARFDVQCPPCADLKADVLGSMRRPSAGSIKFAAAERQKVLFCGRPSGSRKGPKMAILRVRT